MIKSSQYCINQLSSALLQQLYSKLIKIILIISFMISLQSKLNKRNSEKASTRKKIKSKLGVVSASKLKNREKTPLFHSRKGGFSLSKEHTIIFDRMYPQKNLFCQENPQEGESNLDTPTKTIQTKDDSKSIGLSLHRQKSESELKSDCTTDKNSSRITIGQLRRISSEKERYNNHDHMYQTPIRKLNIIKEIPENSFLNP